MPIADRAGNAALLYRSGEAIRIGRGFRTMAVARAIG